MAIRTLKSLTEVELTQIGSVIHSVWGQIQGDMGVCTNLDAVETCLDADRPQMFCGDEGKKATEILRNLNDDFNKIVRFFAKRLKLVY